MKFPGDDCGAFAFGRMTRGKFGVQAEDFGVSLRGGLSGPLSRCLSPESARFPVALPEQRIRFPLAFEFRFRVKPPEHKAQVSGRLSVPLGDAFQHTEPALKYLCRVPKRGFPLPMTHRLDESDKSIRSAILGEVVVIQSIFEAPSIQETRRYLHGKFQGIGQGDLDRAPNGNFCGEC